MSPAVAQLHRYTEVVVGLGTTNSMQGTAYMVGIAFLLFAGTALWRSLTSRY